MNDNNKYEVDNGEVEYPSNATRMKGSVQPEATRGPGDYNFIKSHELDVADTAGVVGRPTLDSGNMGQEGSMYPSLNSNVDTKNSDTTLNTTASTENLSKKYKYPSVHQSIDPLDNPKVTFNDHS